MCYFARFCENKNGRKNSASLVWYLFKNVTHDGLKSEEERYVFSKYYGMEEITGCICYYSILLGGQSMLTTLGIFNSPWQSYWWYQTTFRKWSSPEATESISCFAVLWDPNFSWRGSPSVSGLPRIGGEGRGTYLSFVVENFGRTVSFRQFCSFQPQPFSPFLENT